LLPLFVAPSLNHACHAWYAFALFFVFLVLFWFLKQKQKHKEKSKKQKEKKTIFSLKKENDFLK
jgi:Na+/H+ antiporter NhaC